MAWSDLLTARPAAGSGEQVERDQRRRAAVAVADRATGAEDCAELLGMLELVDGQRRPVGWSL